MNFRRYIAEFIGTFFLMLVVCMTSFAKVSADLQPLAIGATLVGLIYALGYISGAHFNPAVSLAIFLRGRATVKDTGLYIVGQVLGAVLAALASLFLISGKPPVALMVSLPQFFGVGQALVAEVLGTFALVFVILNVATAKALEGNNFYGLSIGLLVSGLIYTLGSVSGSFLNPAIFVASCVAQLSKWNLLWIYLVGGFGGGALAAMAFKFMRLED